MICYTRNFEDVILQRVFADVENGHYVDVGSSNPVNDSNSYALYQKGWRGVAMDPLNYRPLWQQWRPEDVYINAAAGESTDRMTLHVYDDALQISSGSGATVERWKKSGRKSSRSVVVQVLRLDEVIEKHLAQEPLHFMSIDVEGMEHEALKGLDLGKYRPWVLVVEATLPGTNVPSHHAWEPDLLASGYLMVCFDGVNRFYLAQERRSLMGRFALPPNCWDHIQMIGQLELEARVRALEHELAQYKGTVPT